jgi:uncharacterized membrane protein YozB (DUF420 family)
LGWFLSNIFVLIGVFKIKAFILRHVDHRVKVRATVFTVLFLIAYQFLAAVCNYEGFFSRKGGVKEIFVDFLL